MGRRKHLLNLYHEDGLQTLEPKPSLEMTVAYHIDIKCLKFQIVMLNSLLTFHTLMLCVSTAFYLG